jgi:hypothetical protein
MKNAIVSIFVILFSITICFGQYDNGGFIISAGANYSKYLGKGDGDNIFKVSNPGFQLELTANSGRGFEWVMWGFSYFGAQNVVGKSEVPVKFMSPYYTEFAWYQAGKKHPFFCFFGFDVVRMKFPSMEKPDYHYNIPFGGGWNLKLTDQLYLQFKIKPYFVIGNSIGQWFGVNSMINLHLRTKFTD